MSYSKRLLINQIRFFSDKNFKDVLHDKSNKKFIYVIPESNSESFLKYDYINSKKWDLLYVETPPELRGKGIAKIVVEATLKYGMNKNLKFQATCPYVQYYIDNNPKYQHLFID